MDNNTKTGISPSTLCRERKRYLEMSQLDGVTKKQVQAQMKLDAKRYAKKLNKAISFEDYQADILTLPQRANTGKREADKTTRDKLCVETQELNAINNLAILSHRGEIELTSEQKIAAFDVVGDKANTLANHMNTAFDGVQAMTMIHAPKSLLCVHVAGWEDGSKNYRFQYAPRKLPITKRSGYRDDSFESPVYSLNTALEVIPETPPETPETPPPTS